MRVAFYLIYVALFVSVRCEDNTNFVSRLLEPVNVAADPETINYILPKLTTKYRPSSDWRGVTDPRFYVLTEMDSNDINNPETKPKKIRNKRYNYQRDYQPNLSVQAPIQALRNAYDLNTFKHRILQNRRLIDQISSQSYK
ncbi:uncharacterized protein LOC132697401 isoform X3 [Cylas formicarius]|nr:uncharacterized protein LOC132697401 isoform X3 [Cylas formicarius]